MWELRNPEKLTGAGVPMQAFFHQIGPWPSIRPLPLTVRPFTIEKESHLSIGEPSQSVFLVGPTMFPDTCFWQF